MKLSSRSRYAIGAMVELATYAGETEMPIVRMAQNYSLSQSSMEQLFARLRRAGLVAGRRGRRGGYRLARPADEITVADIVGAVDDEYRPRSGRGARAGRKGAASAWDCVSNRLYEYLAGITLEQIMAEAGQTTPKRGSSVDTGRRQAKNVRVPGKKRGRSAASAYASA